MCLIAIAGLRMWDSCFSRCLFLCCSWDVRRHTSRILYKLLELSVKRLIQDPGFKFNIFVVTDLSSAAMKFESRTRDCFRGYEYGPGRPAQETAGAAWCAVILAHTLQGDFKRHLLSMCISNA